MWFWPVSHMGYLGVSPGLHPGFRGLCSPYAALWTGCCFCLLVLVLESWGSILWVYSPGRVCLGQRALESLLGDSTAREGEERSHVAVAGSGRDTASPVALVEWSSHGLRSLAILPSSQRSSGPPESCVQGRLVAGGRR